MYNSEVVEEAEANLNKSGKAYLEAADCFPPDDENRYCMSYLTWGSCFTFRIA